MSCDANEVCGIILNRDTVTGRVQGGREQAYGVIITLGEGYGSAI